MGISKTNRKKLLFIGALAVLTLIVAGCDLGMNASPPSDSNGSNSPALDGEAQSGKNSDAPVFTETTDGNPLKTVTLYAGQTIDAGMATVSVVDDQLLITYKTKYGWELTEVHAWVGTDLNDMPTGGNSGNPQIGLFPYKAEDLEGASATEHTLTVPLEDLGLGAEVCGGEFLIAAHAALRKPLNDGGYQTETGWGAGDRITEQGNWATYFTIEISCDDDPDERDLRPEGIMEAGDFRTQSQGGWGAPARGNNPGVYREESFEKAFPDGLHVGAGYASEDIDAEYTLTLTSADAVQSFLPQGGPPAALTANYSDPTGNPPRTDSENNNLRNVFAGQVVALTLSVGFDRYDPEFGAAEQNLEDLVVASGIFEGMTVAAVLEEANGALGGGESEYSVSQLNDVVSAINENFVDGTKVGTILVLPQE